MWHWWQALDTEMIDALEWLENKQYLVLDCIIKAKRDLRKQWELTQEQVNWLKKNTCFKDIEVHRIDNYIKELEKW